MADVTLTDGDDIYTFERTLGGGTVHGGGGNDTIMLGYSGGAAADVFTLDGGAGNDTLIGTQGNVSFIGGAGDDLAVIPDYRSSNSYSFSLDANGRSVLTNIYSAGGISYTIDPSVETIGFAPNNDGTSGDRIAYADLPKYYAANSVSTQAIQSQHFGGTAAADAVYLFGNPSVYTLSRLPFYLDPTTGQSHAGDFVLANRVAGTVFTVSDSVDYVHFDNRAFPALADLPSVVSAAPSGATLDRHVLAAVTGFQLLVGGSGTDTAELHGALKDYTIRTASAYAADGPETIASHGELHQGVELIATNGSGVYYIDPSIEKVQFVADGVKSFADVTRLIAPAAGSDGFVAHVGVAENEYGPLRFDGTAANNDRALIDIANSIHSDIYNTALSRDAQGDFVLTSTIPYYQPEAATLAISESIEQVQLFDTGQVLSLIDLVSLFAKSDPTFTAGTSGNDLLYAGRGGGDQYITGGAGFDTAYLNGNSWDYAVRAVDQPASGANPAIHGYELVAKNFSGNIYIDASTDAIHMPNGDYFTFTDLPAFVTQNAAFDGGTSADDVFFAQLSGDQYFIGQAGTDTVYLRGNVWDYSIQATDKAAVGTAPAVHGYELVATNGSGNLYVDQTTESVHFQNGLYASYAALGALSQSGGMG